MGQESGVLRGEFWFRMEIFSKEKSGLGGIGLEYHPSGGFCTGAEMRGDVSRENGEPRAGGALPWAPAGVEFNA